MRIGSSRRVPQGGHFHPFIFFVTRPKLFLVELGSAFLSLLSPGVLTSLPGRRNLKQTRGNEPQLIPSPPRLAVRPSLPTFLRIPPQPSIGTKLRIPLAKVRSLFRFVVMFDDAYIERVSQRSILCNPQPRPSIPLIVKLSGSNWPMY